VSARAAVPCAVGPGGMRIERFLWMMGIVALAAASPAGAQLAVEVRGGAGVGNHAASVSKFGLEPGPSVGAALSWAPRPRVEVYAGYSRTGFGCTGGFCPERGIRFTSHGVDAGVRVRLPSAASPWVRAGVVRHALDYGAAPDGVEPSGGRAAGGTGFEVGGGLEVRVGRTLAVTPGIRYVRYGAAGDDGVAMLVADVGLRIRM
jgi:opacity protein-like surface antigen